MVMKEKETTTNVLEEIPRKRKRRNRRNRRRREGEEVDIVVVEESNPPRWRTREKVDGTKVIIPIIIMKGETFSSSSSSSSSKSTSSSGSEGSEKKKKKSVRKRKRSEDDPGGDPRGKRTKKQRLKEDSTKKETPPLKKKFLTAGFYASSDRGDGVVVDDDPEADHHVVVVAKRQTHEYGLLPAPSHDIRHYTEDFRLPYDIWLLHVHTQPPARPDREKPAVAAPITWNYKKIKNNLYSDTVKPLGLIDIQACQCRPKGEAVGCGEDCINRVTFAECDPKLCPLGEKKGCTNNAIQKHRSFQGIERFMTQNKGWGIRAKDIVPAGTFIMEYVGEVVSEVEFKDRMLSVYLEDAHHYCLHLGGGMVIDGHRVGNEGRFVNHGCEPNCDMQKWTVNGLYRMALFSLKDIQAGEELTYDYNFSLFNPHEGQACHCGSEICRGVIGGRSQRVSGQVGKSRDGGRGGRKKAKSLRKTKKTEMGRSSTNHRNQVPMKPISLDREKFILDRHCFLLRNLEKVRKARKRERERKNVNILSQDEQDMKAEKMILTGLTALSTARSVKTRRLTIAQDDPTVSKVVNLVQLLSALYARIVTVTDENGLSLSSHFNSLPSKKHHPQYYLQVSQPIDLQLIDRNIRGGAYAQPEQFDRDFLRLCQNNLRYFGPLSEEGRAAVKLRKIYSTFKQEHYAELEEIVGPEAAVCFQKKDEVTVDPAVVDEEDVIRCPCSQYKDEGLMIQCEKCQVWQHCDCVGVKSIEEVEHYFCERCEGREPNLDIVLVPQPVAVKPEETYYTSLKSGKLQVCVGDTVYVLRSKVQRRKVTDEEGAEVNRARSTMKSSSQQELSQLSKDSNNPKADPRFCAMDIFRVESLWINERGRRFAFFGHQYLRPEQTFHEPERKFFHNEVFQVPVAEELPLDAVRGKCWVLDVPSSCKGRPIGALEEHVYICEYRVDNAARSFYKISKPKYPVCTKQHAFDNFDYPEARPERTYMPRDITKRLKSRNGCLDKDDPHQEQNVGLVTPSSSSSDSQTSSTSTKSEDIARPHGSRKGQIRKQKKLAEIVSRLLLKLPGSNPIDASYLLNRGRGQE